jgi:hypothetical protein
VIGEGADFITFDFSRKVDDRAHLRRSMRLKLGNRAFGSMKISSRRRISPERIGPAGVAVDGHIAVAPTWRVNACFTPIFRHIRFLQHSQR